MAGLIEMQFGQQAYVGSRLQIPHRKGNCLGDDKTCTVNSDDCNVGFVMAMLPLAKFLWTRVILCAAK